MTIPSSGETLCCFFFSFFLLGVIFLIPGPGEYGVSLWWFPCFLLLIGLCRAAFRVELAEEIKLRTSQPASRVNEWIEAKSLWHQRKMNWFPCLQGSWESRHTLTQFRLCQLNTDSWASVHTVYACVCVYLHRELGIYFHITKSKQAGQPANHFHSLVLSCWDGLKWKRRAYNV